MEKLYTAGVLDCKFAVPATLHALGVSPEEIDKAVEEACEKREKEEKFAKVAQMEMSLQEPSVSQNQIVDMQTEVMDMERQIEELEAQLERQGEVVGDGKLAVYKQQANLVTKKKEMAQADLGSCLGDLMAKHQ